MLPWKLDNNIIYCPNRGLLESERHAIYNYSGTTGILEQTGTVWGHPAQERVPPSAHQRLEESLQVLSANDTCTVVGP